MNARSRLFAILVAGFSVAASTPCAVFAAPPRFPTPDELATPVTLAPGDPAPPLSIQRWAKGDPVASFQPGTVYIVDFWAVWCGPCLAIMPELSDIQDRHPTQVVAIGLTNPDDDNTDEAIDKTISRRQESMRFRVVVDDGQTTERYLIAVRESAIPCSFLIDQQGRLAWHGHPQDLAPVLKSVLDGTWDLAAARAAQQRRSENAIRSRALSQDYVKALRAKDREAQLQVARRAAELPVADMQGYTPDYWGWLSQVECLVDLDRVPEARSIASVAARTPGVADNAYALAQIAQKLQPVAFEDASRYADQAFKLVQDMESRPPAGEWQSFLLEGEARRNAAVRIITADIRAAQGRKEEAAALLRPAIEAWTDNERMVPNKAELKRRLAEYESR